MDSLWGLRAAGRKEGITSIITQKFFGGKRSGLAEEGGGFVRGERLRGSEAGGNWGEITVGCSGSRGFREKWGGRYAKAESREKCGMREYEKTGRAGRGGPSRGVVNITKFLGEGLCKLHNPGPLLLQELAAGGQLLQHLGTGEVNLKVIRAIGDRPFHLLNLGPVGDGYG